MKCGVCGVDSRSRKRAFVFEFAFPKNFKKMVLSYASANFCNHATSRHMRYTSCICIWQSRATRVVIPESSIFLAPRTLSESPCTADTCTYHSCAVSIRPGRAQTWTAYKARPSQLQKRHCRGLWKRQFRGPGGSPGEGGLQDDDVSWMTLRHRIQLLARADKMHVTRVPLQFTRTVKTKYTKRYATFDKE